MIMNPAGGESSCVVEDYDGHDDGAPSGPSVPDGAVAGVIVMQPDGSPCVGWLMAHPSVANVSATKRQALVQLNVLHAHDLELQTCIATDDERIVAATRYGDTRHMYAPATSGLLAQPDEPALDREAFSAGGGRRCTAEAPASEGGRNDTGGASRRDWLAEMRARDAALQARIAQGDAAVFGGS
eukprot:jgi/Ulvmu1/12356/UM009_0002.1